MLRFPLLGSVLAFALVQNCHGGTGAFNVQEHLTGRNTGTRAASLAADRIVVAALVDRGTADAGAPGQAYFGQAQARIVRWLHGNPAEAKNPETIVFNYAVQTLPDSIAEKAPVVGQYYIFFLHLGTAEPTATKILAADADEVRVVEETLAKRH